MMYENLVSDEVLQSYLNTDQTYCEEGVPPLDRTRVEVIKDFEEGFTVIPDMKMSFNRQHKSNLFSTRAPN
jgi:hypothetical protein